MHHECEMLDTIENLAKLWTTATGNGPAAITRRAAGHDILRIIADRTESIETLPPTTRNETNSGTWGNAPKAFNDPTVECCGRDAADCDCPPEVPCLCQGLSHYEGCPNWELPD